MHRNSRTESRSGLVVELAEEFLDRYRKGERPPLSEYIDRYPEYADEIREVFPALAMLENIAVEERPPDQAPAAGSARPRLAAIDQLGDFRILREIGHGGMGIVYEAEQISLGRHVALKLLPPQMLRDPKQRRRFQREARAAARLHHANIVPVFGVGEHDGTPYYAMQFIPGHGLDQVLDELRRLRDGCEVPAAATARDTGSGVPGGSTAALVARSLWAGGLTSCGGATEAPPAENRASATAAVAASSTGPAAQASAGAQSHTALVLGASTASLFGASGSSSLGGSSRPPTYWQRAAHIGTQVAEALAYAHGQGVLHRDVKPSNLLLDLHGNVWVTDFGLAKLDDQQNLTGTGDILGTLRYMPPEAFEGKADARGDVYSLGLTLYELMALRPAFNETDRARLIRLVTADAPPRLRKLNPDVPRDLETVIHKAIDRDPDHRYKTAAELAEDLKLFVEDRPVRARRASEAEKFLRWCRRNPVPAGLLAALVLVFWAGFGLVAWNWREALAQREAKDEQRLKALAASREAHAARDEALAAEKTARDAAERADRNLYFSLIDRARLERESANIAEAEAILDRCDPARRGWEWHFLKGLNHAELFTLRGHGDGAWTDSVAYSPDGRWIATAGGGDPYYGNPGHEAVPGTVIVWDAETGRPVHTLREHKHLIFQVAFSRDGRILASSSIDGIITIHDAATGRLVQTLVAVKPSSAGQGQSTYARALPLALAPDGKRLATIVEDRALAVWDIGSARRLLALPSQPSGYAKAVFSPDGRWLATADGAALDGSGREVRLWDLATGADSARPENSYNYCSLAFSPDSQTLAGASTNGFISLWNPADGKLQRVLSGHQGIVSDISFSPDGLFLASVSHDRTVRLWDVRNGGLERVIRGHLDIITSLAFSPDGDRLVTGSQDGTARVWDLTLDPELGFAGNQQPREIEAIAYAHGGREFLNYYRSGEIQRNEVGTFIETGAISGGVCTGWITPAEPAAFSADGRRAIAVEESARRQATCLDLEGGGQAITLSGHALEISAATLSADGRCAATGANSGRTDPSRRSEVFVWDAGAGRLLRRIEFSGVGIYRIALNPSGKLLALSAGPPLFGHSGTQQGDCFIALVDVDSGREILRRDVPGEPILALAFSTDGQRLAAAGTNRSVLICNTASGHVLAQSSQGPELAMDLCFSPDPGAPGRLAVASRQQVKLMDAETAAEVLTLRGRGQLTPNNHGFNPRARFSPDGRSLLAICDDAGAGLAEWSSAKANPVADETSRRMLRRRAAARHLNLARRYLLQGDQGMEGFLNHLDQAAQIGLDTPQEFLSRAEMFTRVAKWQRVENDLNQAAALAPGDDATVARAALIYADQGQFQRAGAWFSRMKSLSPVLLTMRWGDSTRFLLLSGDQVRYRQLREAIWRRYGSSPVPSSRRDAAYVCASGTDAMGESEAVVRVAQQACDHFLANNDPNVQTVALIALGAAHLRAGARSRAEPCFREAIARAPGSVSRATATAWLATCLLHQGRRDEARTWFNQADRCVRAQLPDGRPEREQPAPRLGETWNWWWDLLLAWREAQGLLLDEAFPTDPFSRGGSSAACSSQRATR
jgi:WD40 repeat protein/serine/threonine protein kinase/Tfp pilus assembly protein PilF